VPFHPNKHISGKTSNNIEMITLMADDWSKSIHMKNLKHVLPESTPQALLQ